MPTVDFTKEELLTEIGVLIIRHVDERMERRFIQERAYTKQMIADTFMSFWEANFEPAFARLETDYKIQARLLAQHSEDIMELRARTA